MLRSRVRTPADPPNGTVAQLARAIGSYPVGRRFESYLCHQTKERKNNMPKNLLTVREIVENFLENTDIKLVKNEEYEQVMGWYDMIVALPRHEYDELLYIKDKYYADVEGWCEEDE